MPMAMCTPFNLNLTKCPPHEKDAAPTYFFWLLANFNFVPLPVFYFLLNWYLNVGIWNKLDQRMENIHAKKMHYEEIQKKQHSVINSLSQSNPTYIDQYLETLTFLEPEIKKMETLFADNSVDEATNRRLQFLKSGSNRLLFTEEKIRSKEKIREVVERQQHPVEMDEEDLKRLLCVTEGITIWPYGPKEGRPQLIVQDFQLQKKHLPSNDNVFVVQMQLLKRENNEK